MSSKISNHDNKSSSLAVQTHTSLLQSIMTPAFNITLIIIFSYITTQEIKINFVFLKGLISKNADNILLFAIFVK